MMAYPGDCGFVDSFRSRLIEVEHHTLLEVQRLGEALAALHAENEGLRRQLAAEAPGSCNSAGTLGSGSAAEAPGPCKPPCGPPCSPPRSPCGPLVVEEWPESPAGPQHQPSPSRAASFRSLGERQVSEGSYLSVPGSSAASLQTEVRTRVSRRRQESRSVRHYKRIGFAQRVARSSAFEYGTLALVVLNAAWMAIDLDLNGRALLESPLHFQLIEHLFVALFSLEIAVRFLAFEHKRLALSDRWFVFDTGLVLLMVVDSWLVTLFVLVTDSSGLTGLGSVSVLRTLRILRLGRIARLCAVVPELETMVSSMLAGVRSVLTAAVFLLAMTYGFAIALRQMGESTAWGTEHFASVPGSVWTLLVESMLPDNGELLGRMGQERWYCSVVYFAFLLFSAVLLMNMLVGLLCDVVFEVSHNEKMQRGIDSMSTKLQTILRSIDRNYDGLVSKAEFESMIENKDAVSILSDVGVDVVALVGESDFIFSQHGRSQLPFEDFRDEVLSFRSTSSPTMGVITALKRFTHMGLEQIAGRLATVEMLLHHNLRSELRPLEPPAKPPSDVREAAPPGELHFKRSL